MGWLRRALVALGTLGIASLGCSVAPASAASSLEILTLRLQPCPQYRALRTNTYSETRRQAALDGDFELMAGQPAHLVPPVDWTQDPYDNRSWRHRLHAFPWIDELLFSYVRYGDETALARARDLLVDWVIANPQSNAATTEFAWSDKGTADRAGYLGFITRATACEGLLSDPQASLLLDSIQEHAAFVADDANHRDNNHGLFTDYGLALLSDYAHFLAGSSQWRATAQRRFEETFLARVIPEEGMYLEHSTGYQFAIINLVSRFVDVIASSELTALLPEMRDAAGWLVTPEGRMTPYGDTQETNAIPSWAEAESEDDDGLNVMRRAGLAVVKSGGGYLLVTAGFHNVTHKHPDELGFHLYDRGGSVVTDSGNYDYDYERKWRQFSASVRAHSVLITDAREFPIEDEFAYGSGIIAGGQGDGWYAIEGKNPLLRQQKVRHRRLFLYRPGRALLVLDTVLARRQHNYIRLFQIAPRLQALRGNRRKLHLRAKGFRGVLRDVGDPARRRAVKGHFSPPRGWSFPAFRRRVARWTVEYRSRDEDATYLAAFGLRGSVKAKVLTRKKGSLRIRVGGAVKRSTLTVSRSGGRLLVASRPGR